MRVSDSEIRILRIEAERTYDAGGELVAEHEACQGVRIADRLAADQIRPVANSTRRRTADAVLPAIFGEELESARSRRTRQRV